MNQTDINDKGQQYKIILKYKQTIQNDDNCISLCLLNSVNDNITSNFNKKSYRVSYIWSKMLKCLSPFSRII